jgi:hypothetical protein
MSAAVAGIAINATTAALETKRRKFFTRNPPEYLQLDDAFPASVLADFLSLKQLCRNGFLDLRPREATQARSRWGTHDT